MSIVLNAAPTGRRWPSVALTLVLPASLALSLAACSSAASPADSGAPSGAPSDAPSPTPSFVAHDVPATPEVRVASWTLDIGSETWGAPLVIGSTAYLGSNDGVLRAIDTQAGTVVWEYPTAGEIRGGAATDGDALYVSADDGVLYAVALDGTPRWATPIGGAATRGSWDNYGSRPAVADGVVYAGSYDGTVAAVDAATGAVRWTFDVGAPIETGIVLGEGLIHVDTMEGYHYALDPITGEQVWLGVFGAAATTTSLVVDGTLIGGSRAASVRAFDAATGTPRWMAHFNGSWVQSGAIVIGPDTIAIGSSDKRTVQAFLISDGSHVWETPVSGAPWAIPALAGGVVYETSISIDLWAPWGPSLFAIDAATGGLLWTADGGDSLEFTPDGYAGHGIGAAPAIAGDYVIVAGLDGIVSAYTR